MSHSEEGTVNEIRWVRLNGWNEFATRFVEAPVWTWDPVDGVTSYRARFAWPGHPALSLETSEPSLSMAPAWDRVPFGQVDLVVEGFDASGREISMPSWPKRFYKVPGFDGVRQDPL